MSVWELSPRGSKLVSPLFLDRRPGIIPVRGDETSDSTAYNARRRNHTRARGTNVKAYGKSKSDYESPPHAGSKLAPTGAARDDAGIIPARGGSHHNARCQSGQRAKPLGTGIIGAQWCQT